MLGIKVSLGLGYCLQKTSFVFCGWDSYVATGFIVTWLRLRCNESKLDNSNRKVQHVPETALPDWSFTQVGQDSSEKDSSSWKWTGKVWSLRRPNSSNKHVNEFRNAYMLSWSWADSLIGGPEQKTQWGQPGFWTNRNRESIHVYFLSC